VRDLLLKMREVGEISDEELETALAEPLVFARG
jgi:hypothetical protein